MKLHLPVARTWDGLEWPGLAAEFALALVPEGLSVTTKAPFRGDPPPPGPPGPTWALWEHEVIELFVLGPDERYTELELGPYGHYLLLRLEGRRNIVEKLLPLEAEWSRDTTTWRVTTLLPWAVLPPRPWRGNACAIHGIGAERRYLSSAALPGPQPDFHRLECFAPLYLESPEAR